MRRTHRWLIGLPLAIVAVFCFSFLPMRSTASGNQSAATIIPTQTPKVSNDQTALVSTIDGGAADVSAQSTAPTATTPATNTGTTTSASSQSASAAATASTSNQSTSKIANTTKAKSTSSSSQTVSKLNQDLTTIIHQLPQL